MAGFMGGTFAQSTKQADPNVNPLLPKPTVKPATPLENQYKLYNSGVAQNAEDYSGIMQGYQNILSRANSATPLNYQTYNPQTYNYQQSPQLSSSIQNLEGLSQSGGYSQSDISNLRERGISPIRSVYANANRDIDRQRSLQGGFSPNYNAVKAKMARELSDTLANQVTDVNAGIAQNVAQNRVNLAPQLAQVTGQQSNLANQMGVQNADTMNQAQQFNIQTPLQYAQLNQQPNEQALQALQGMSSLYGTTPAMSNLFGNQAMQAAQFQNQQQNQQQQNAFNGLGMLAGRLG